MQVQRKILQLYADITRNFPDADADICISKPSSDYSLLPIGKNMRLKELREARGISQLKLAMDLSMAQNSISRYENGVREADYTTLIRFADYFNVSLDYLLERTDNPEMAK